MKPGSALGGGPLCRWAPWALLGLVPVLLSSIHCSCGACGRWGISLGNREDVKIVTKPEFVPPHPHFLLCSTPHPSLSVSSCLSLPPSLNLGMCVCHSLCVSVSLCLCTFPSLLYPPLARLRVLGEGGRDHRNSQQCVEPCGEGHGSCVSR